MIRYILQRLFGMIVVMALVVVPARRDGREVLTERGEEVVAGLKARSEDARARLERSHAA